MDVHPPGKALALAPVDDTASANAEAKRDLRITTADEFLIAAAKEYQDRQIDHALWRRAVDQCGGDTASVIPAYLRARATALKLLQKEDERSQKRAQGAGAAGGASDRRVESEASPQSVSTKVAGARPRDARGIKYAAAGAATSAFIVAVAWLIASPRENESVRPPVAAAVPAPSRSAPSTPRGSDHATNQDSLEPPLEVRVQELKKAGNWNILVLYASEWTRKDPRNAAAWHELSVGYANLRQFGDALDAARKAVELAPEGSSLWSNLGRVNLAVRRLPEAAIAFDRALALSPDDPDALCGAASVAQRQGRPNDADVLARRVKSADGGCPDLSDAAGVTAVASGSVTRKPVRSVGH